MTTVQDILTFLQTLAPTQMQEQWDNTGLLCGRADKPVKTVLVALDPFLHVCREAAELGADLLLTHHPLIFHPLTSITADDPVGACVHTLIKSDICAVNAHTNLDCAPGGVNDTLAQALDLTNVSVLDPKGLDSQGRPWGLIRTGTVPETALADFLKQVKANLNCKGLRYVDGGVPVRKVAVGGGSCADELERVKAAGCDTFVTADVKYNQFWDAQSYGINLIDAGHFATEDPVCDVLVQALQTQFPEIQVLRSKKHKDCMNFF